LEYLFGSSYSENGTLKFRDWWAHDRKEEQAAFEGFVRWVHGRWKSDKTMHVYHYAAYETSALTKLLGQPRIYSR